MAGLATHKGDLSTLESPVPFFFIKLKFLCFSFSSDHHVLAYCGGFSCSLGTKLVGPWVTFSICAVWLGSKWVPVARLCAVCCVLKGRSVSGAAVGRPLSSSSYTVLPGLDLI